MTRNDKRTTTKRKHHFHLESYTLYAFLIVTLFAVFAAGVWVGTTYVNKCYEEVLTSGVKEVTYVENWGLY